MGVAAKAIADVVAPAPPARVSNANSEDDGRSFQDHVDAADQRPQRSEPTRAKSNTRPSADDTSTQHAETTANAKTADADTKQDEHPEQAAAHPQVLLQLIATTAPKVLGAKAEQQAAAQQDATATAEQSANADATQTAAVVVTAAPVNTTPKGEAGTRPPQVRTKGAAAKADANSAEQAAQTPVATDTSASAPGAIATIATPTAPQNDGKNNEDAKASAIDGAQSAPSRAETPKQKAPTAPTAAPPESTLQSAATTKSEPSQAKNRDGAKALASADALKQVAQDFAAAAPAKAEAPAATSTPAATHTALAEPAQQTSSESSAQRGGPVASQVGGEIVRRFNGSDTSFQMRLDPPELGRVDVRLDVSREHRVTAVITADNPQALSDLSRGARDLQQALQSAGLDLADDGLRFNLSSNGQGNSFAQAQMQQDQTNSRATSTAQTETSVAPEVTASRPLSIDSWRGSRVDLVA